jgi:hypothetical protein
LLRDVTADVLRKISLVKELANDSTLPETTTLNDDTAEVLRDISLVKELANDSTLATAVVDKFAMRLSVDTN